MTEPTDLSLGSDAEMEATGTENRLTSITTSTRNWILYLPPEIRIMIYRNVLQLPHEIFWRFPLLHTRPRLQALLSLLRTSSVIRAEAIPVFFRENTFIFSSRSPSLATGSFWWLIRNVTMFIELSARDQGPREQFLDILHHLGNPSTIRGKLTLYIALFFPFFSRHRCLLLVYICGLGRFTNFRAVELQIVCLGPRAPNPAIFYDFFENAQRQVLGPATAATPRVTGEAETFVRGPVLTFFPQQFVNAQPRREDVDWMEYLDGIRLTWNGDETDAN